MANTYFDGDGLLRKYGNTKTVPNYAGEYKLYGDLREVEVRIDLTLLSATALIVSDQVFFPKSVRIEEVVLDVQTAVTGSSTLSVGLIQSDRSSVIDATAFLNAETQTNMATVGKKITYDSTTTNHGTKLGVTNTTVGYITATGTGTAFTAGVVYVRIRYRPDTQ